MTNILAAILVGLLSGLHVASWGMYKDAPHEGFELRKYLRSILVGVGLGAAAGAVLPLDVTAPAGFAVLFGVVYVVERALGEIYKTFFRQEDQSKYTIPMQFAVFGTTVESRALRAVLGLGYLGVMLGMLALVAAYQRLAGPELSLIEVACVGSAGAWISALGGAWKDAPIEGFQILKFFRSPTLAALWALLLAQLTPDLVLVTLAATGYTIATTETYKSFLFPSRPRGKFAGKPVLFPTLLQLRQRVVPLYVAIWLTVLAMFSFGLERVSHG
ncbi:MAG TPA: hypothetical protein VHH32_06415 [Gemmatimonadales bacterium]|nr:hypothetical protein [Gemmatimonadales bacterium]